MLLHQTHRAIQPGAWMRKERNMVYDVLTALAKVGGGEVLAQIMQYLTGADCQRLRLVSHALNNACTLAPNTEARVIARLSGRFSRQQILCTLSHSRGQNDTVASSYGSNDGYDGWHTSDAAPGMMWRSCSSTSDSVQPLQTKKVDHRTEEGDLLCSREHIARWAIQNVGMPVDEKSCACAAFNGSKDVLFNMLMFEFGAQATEEVLAAACAGANTEIVGELVLRHGVVPGKMSVKAAARSNSIECLELLRDAGGVVLDESCTACAAECDAVKVLQWLFPEHAPNKAPWCEQAAWLAAERGSWDALHWMLHHNMDGVLKASTSVSAAISGRADIVRMLLSSGGAQQGSIPRWRSSECKEEAALWLIRMGLASDNGVSNETVQRQAALTSDVDVLRALSVEGIQLGDAAETAYAAGFDGVIHFLEHEHSRRWSVFFAPGTKQKEKSTSLYCSRTVTQGTQTEVDDTNARGSSFSLGYVL